MFGIGGFELFIILLFGFLVFGPDKLPEIAKTVGAALRKFQDAQKEMESVIKDEVLVDPDKKPAPTGKAASSTETFAERKARYDKERAERLNANSAKPAPASKEKDPEVLANREALKKQAAEMAERNRAQEEAVAKERASRRTAGATGDVPKPSAVAENKPALTPDELFGNTPIKKNAPKKVVSLTDEAARQAADPVQVKTLEELGMAPEKPAAEGAAAAASQASDAVKGGE